MSPPNSKKDLDALARMVKPKEPLERVVKEMVIENRIREANEQIIEKIF